MNSTATEQEVMVIMGAGEVNGRAQRNREVHHAGEMPAFAERTVTGMVAAEDWVPIAVKYAGSMVLSIWMGLRREIAPATEYCSARGDPGAE